jgi:enoyl-CoA hydratase
MSDPTPVLGRELTHLRLERPASGVALLTLDLPERRNAVSAEMSDSWVRAIDALAADSSVTCVRG